MIRNQEDDEFVAVRVQDPRMQNEGSWNSYVDYKIFLHTNSKAFTAKTSCVRRRYSEFAWLKKKLQKNSGLVPVPELPGKSFFFYSNEDFLERRRKGLQAFLDNVVNMTVCLSDSQLHLFLQTQLPVGHIQDCVQGHTPYSVTDAILTYASSNRGYAQAQEEDSIKEPSLTVSYESMESPAPHQPFLQPKEIFSPDLLSHGDSDPLEGSVEVCDEDTVGFQQKEQSSVRVLQKNNHLEAVVEDCVPTEVTFFLGDIQDAPESLRLAEQTQQRSCQIQTPVEVHLPMGSGFEENGADGLMEEESLVREESATTLDPEEETVPQPDTEEETVPQPDTQEETVPQPDTQEETVPQPDTQEETVPQPDTQEETVPQPDTQEETVPQPDTQEETVPQPDTQEETVPQADTQEETVPQADTQEETVPQADTQEKSDQCEASGMPEVEFEQKFVNSAAVLDFMDIDFKEQETDIRPREEVLEVVCSDRQDSENHVISEANSLEQVDGPEVHIEEASCLEEIKNSGGQKELDHENSESESKEETPLQSETRDVHSVLEVERSGADTVQQMDQVEQEVDLVGTKDDSDEDSHSSSNDSIVQVSDEESICDDEDSIQAANGFMKTSPEEVVPWSQGDASSGNILDLHVNGRPVEKEDVSAEEDEDLHYITDITDLSTSLDLNLTVTGGDLTENSDFSILENSCRPVLADGKCTEQNSLSLEASEDTHEVEEG